MLDFALASARLQLLTVGWRVPDCGRFIYGCDICGRELLELLCTLSISRAGIVPFVVPARTLCVAHNGFACSMSRLFNGETHLEG